MLHYLWDASKVKKICGLKKFQRNRTRTLEKQPLRARVLQVPKNLCIDSVISKLRVGTTLASEVAPLSFHLLCISDEMQKIFILKTTFPLVSKIVTSAVFPLWSSIVYILHFATFFMLIHLNKKINHGNKCLILPIGFSIASIIFTT